MFEILKVVVGVVSLFFVLRVIRHNCNKYLAFAIVAIWLRLFLSAFYTITYPPLFAGLSLNAIGSIGVVCVGLLVLPLSLFKLKKLMPFYILFFAILISGVINTKIGGTVNLLVKWFYFLVLMIAVFLSVHYYGKNETLKKLLVAFTMPVALQLLSILLGHAKATEADGSTSFIGGYSHEAAFSMVIVTFVFILGMLERNTLRMQTALFTLALILLVLVNYRTSILTVLPIAAIFYFTQAEQKIKPSQKPAVMTVITLILAVIFILLSFSMRERFTDVGSLIANLDVVLKAPEYLSQTERSLMSSRVYIWSQYIDGYRNAGVIRHIFGFGAESWRDAFKLYAHNTFISYLYEFGVVGFISLIGLCLYIVGSTIRIANKAASRTLLFTFFGFLAMNSATMPLWNIEGLMFFAIFIGLMTSENSKFNLKRKEAVYMNYVH
jgi:hypothetical protein